MVDIVTVDFETYYDKDYSLSKLTTEAYIRDPRFEVIGVAVKVNDQETDWYSGPDPGRFLRSLDWSDKWVLAHNTAFDAAILSWHFDIHPPFLLDTMSMARPKHANGCGVSLKALANFYGLQAKGDEVIHALGKRRKDFTPAELSRYADYCIGDVNITYELFKVLRQVIPQSALATELQCINTTLKMFTEPMLVFDKAKLEAHLVAERARKEKILAKLGGDSAKALLNSNPKFAELLRALNVEPPMKMSKTTGKETYAFAKNDKAFLALQEHPDPRVQAVVGARLGTKSSLEETRTLSFIEIAERGPLPVPLKYYAAHTGRFGGGEKINLQNLPRGGALRETICAPDGYSLVTCDLSQIEARVLACIAGQWDLVQAFREGRDIYSEFASKFYGWTVNKTNKVERFVGKTCLSSSTMVLTRRGWVRIADVLLSDQLWDGEEWVTHQGVSFMGVRPTISLSGVEVTPDHEILTGPTKWEPAQTLLESRAAFQSALGLATLPSSGMSSTSPTESSGAGDLCVYADAAGQHTPTMPIVCGRGGLRLVTDAPNARQIPSASGCTEMRCRTTCIESACSTGSQRQSLGATVRRAKCINTTVLAESTCTKSGAMTAPSSCAMSKPYPVGTTLREIWTAWTTTEATSPVIYASQRGLRTRPTNDASRTWKPVFDILNSGLRNRFTVLTADGPIIVHNCILGLGFGMGWEKFQHTLAIGQGGVSAIVSADQARNLVDMYRRTNSHIVRFWDAVDRAINDMYMGGCGELAGGIVHYDQFGMTLPNGLRIDYPQLKRGKRGFEYVNDLRMHSKDPENGWTNIYGGKATENLVQAIARIVIVEMMNKIAKRYRVVLQVHDEIVICVPDADVPVARAYMEKVMNTPPKWLPQIPVACESGVGKNYSEAK